MAEALVSESINFLLEKLLSGAVKEIIFAANIDSHIKDLAHTKAMIHAKLLDEDALQENVNHVQRQELERLSRALDKIDDLLDEKAARSKLKEIAAASGFKNRVNSFFSADLNSVVSLCRDMRQVKDISEELYSIARHRSQFGTLVMPSRTVSQTPALNLETGSHVLREDVIGRERDRDNIIESLLKPSPSFFVITIVGIGGLGKTTLAQYVYNDERVKKHFDQRLWVYATRDFCEIEMLQRIITAAGEEIPRNPTKDSLQQILLTKIKRKKYLLVLDNIWADDTVSLNSKWEELRKLLRCGDAGSKVVITTRDKTVARIVGSTNPYMLEDLGKKDSWLLFQRTAFPAGGAIESGLEEIGREILKLCPKVPLVIRTIGGLLREKEPTKDKWRVFRYGPLKNLASNAPNVMQSLKLSYNHLDPRLKQCLAYCSLFPQGWLFDKHELICLWIALGYVEAQDGNQSLDETGEEYMLSLMNRGFFQNAEKDEFGCITSFRMHDLIYDLVVQVASSKCKIVESCSSQTCQEIDVGVCHVSQLVEDPQAMPTLPLKMKEKLRSFLLLKRIDGNRVVPELKLSLDLSRFRCLRVLRLPQVGLIEVPKSIGKLIHLRYLDLSHNHFEKLPNSIGSLIHMMYLDLSGNHFEKLPSSTTQLVNLLSLNLSGCGKFQELPRDMKKLAKLRHLHIEDCDALEHMPSGLGNLTDLQTLDFFLLGKDKSISKDVGGLDELNCLNNLKGRLSIEVGSDSESGWGRARDANLQGKVNLTSLVIKFIPYGGKKISEEKSEILLEGLQPPPNLRYLNIFQYFGERLPSWMTSSLNSYVPNLVTIELSSFTGTKHLCYFGQLPHLKVLILFLMDKMEYIEKGVSNIDIPNPSNPFTRATAGPSFPSLEILKLYDMPKLKGWRESSSGGEEEKEDSRRQTKALEFRCYNSGFPRLNELLFFYVGFEVVPEEFQGLSSLKSLCLDNCFELKEIPEWIDTFTSLKKLEIKHCFKLKSLPKQIANLTNLESLTIRFFPGLIERCQKSSGVDWPLIQHVPCVSVW